MNNCLPQQVENAVKHGMCLHCYQPMQLLSYNARQKFLPTSTQEETSKVEALLKLRMP
jgi:hypothetical protein